MVVFIDAAASFAVITVHINHQRSRRILLGERVLELLFCRTIVYEHGQRAVPLDEVGGGGQRVCSGRITLLYIVTFQAPAQLGPTMELMVLGGLPQSDTDEHVHNADESHGHDKQEENTQLYHRLHEFAVLFHGAARVRLGKLVDLAIDTGGEQVGQRNGATKEPDEEHDLKSPREATRELLRVPLINE